MSVPPTMSAAERKESGLPDSDQTLGERVRRLRQSRGLTQAALGKLVGMSQQTVHTIEQGDSQRPRRLPELAQALGTSVDFLAYGTGPRDVASERQAVADRPPESFQIRSVGPGQMLLRIEQVVTIDQFRRIAMILAEPTEER